MCVLSCHRTFAHAVFLAGNTFFFCLTLPTPVSLFYSQLKCHLLGVRPCQSFSFMADTTICSCVLIRILVVECWSPAPSPRQTMFLTLIVQCLTYIRPWINIEWINDWWMNMWKKNRSSVIFNNLPKLTQFVYDKAGPNIQAWAFEAPWIFWW